MNLIQEIRERVFKKNRNALLCFVGQTGSGKSWSALHFAELLDPTFSVDRVCFKAKEFMDLLDSGKLKRGNVIIFDEAAALMPSREFMSLTNRLLSYVLITFRHMNLIVIFIAPSIEMIDLNARKLFHYYFETKAINMTKELCYLKPMMIQENPRSGKLYFKYPRMRGGIKLISLRVHKPGADLIEAYEKKRKEYSKELREDIKTSITDLEQKKNKPKPLTDEECIEIIKKKLKGEKVTASKIRSIVPVSCNRSEKLRDKIKYTYK